MALLNPVGRWLTKPSNALILGGLAAIAFNLSFHTDMLTWFILGFFNFLIQYFFILLGIYSIMCGLSLKLEE